MAREIREQEARADCALDMAALILLERLDIERQRAGWTHQTFAAHLGMSPTVWRDLRKGKSEFSAHHYVTILRQLPGLAGFVFRHLSYRAQTEDE